MLAPEYGGITLMAIVIVLLSEAVLNEEVQALLLVFICLAVFP